MKTSQGTLLNRKNGTGQICPNNWLLYYPMGILYSRKVDVTSFLYYEG